MKIKLILSAFALMLSISAAYASFPVKKVTVSTTTENVSAENTQTDTVYAPVAKRAQQSMGIALILWFFLGWPFAAHRWYLKSPVGWNILFILTFAGVGIWALIDLIDIFLENYPNANFKSTFF